jgi:hypothetical protein
MRLAALLVLPFAPFALAEEFRGRPDRQVST